MGRQQSRRIDRQGRTARLEETKNSKLDESLDLNERLEHFLRDLRCASRSLRNSPGFTAAAILTLTLAIGANTAIFSALEGVVLEPLMYRDPNRLVMMALYNRTLKSAMSLSYPDFLDWQQASRSF